MGIVFASMIVFVYIFIQCFTVKLLPQCGVIRKEINKVGIVFVFMIEFVCVFVQFVAVVWVLGAETNFPLQQLGGQSLQEECSYERSFPT